MARRSGLFIWYTLALSKLEGSLVARIKIALSRVGWIHRARCYIIVVLPGQDLTGDAMDSHWYQVSSFLSMCIHMFFLISTVYKYREVNTQKQ